MRVVVDTNVLISFAIRPNQEFQRFFDFLAVHGTLLVSDETIGELLDVLSRDKFRKYIPAEQGTDYVEWYLGLSEKVSANERIQACRDPRDDKFLSLAVAGSADCIIAGDHDLLDMCCLEVFPFFGLPSSCVVS